LLGSLCALHRRPFHAALLLKQFPAPYTIQTLIRAALALGMVVRLKPLAIADLQGLVCVTIATDLRHVAADRHRRQPDRLVRQRLRLQGSGANVRQLANADRSAWAMSAHLLDTHLTMNDGSAWGGELAVRHATHGDSPDLFGIARDELVHPSFGAQAQVVGTRFGSSPIGIAA